MTSTSLKNKTLYIFDWDGTIMDSIAQIVASIHWAAEKLGVSVTDDAAKNIIGLGLPEAIQTLFPDHADKWQDIHQNYAKDYVTHSDETQLYDGIQTLIETLHSQGKLLAVATGKSRKGLDRVLHESKLEPFFTATRGADETKSKPNPLMLNEILAETGVNVDNAVMIGDTSYDMEMAQNIGMDRIAVSYGVHEIAVLEKYQPNAIVQNRKELADLIL